MGINKKKVSELPLVSSLVGLYTIGVDNLNNSVKVSLEWLRTAADGVASAISGANAAADNANSKANAANSAATAANNAATAANTAKDSANTAAQNANEKAAAANSAAGNATSAAQDVGLAIEAATNAADNAGQKANEAQTAANNAVIATEGANAAKNAAASAAVLAGEKAVEAATATEAADTATALAKAAAENVKDGKTTQFKIGTVEKTAPGGDPVVTLTDKGEDEQGNPKRAINLTLPTGNTGPVPVIEIGTVTSVVPGANPSATLVENGVTAEGVKKYKLNLVLVKGDAGAGNVDITNSGDLIKDTPYILTPKDNGSQQYTAQEAITGGRNLITEDRFKKAATYLHTRVYGQEGAYGNLNAAHITSTGDGYFRVNGVVKRIGTYSLGFWAKIISENEVDPVKMHVDICDAPLVSGYNATVTTQWTYVALQNVNLTRVDGTYSFVDIGIPAGTTIAVSDMMLVEGPMVSMPVPAPEDFATKLSVPSGYIPYNSSASAGEPLSSIPVSAGVALINSVARRTSTGQIKTANATSADEAATLQQLTDHNTSVTAHTDIRNKIDTSITAHNASGTAHTDIRDKVSDVDAIARGKARARVFDTVADLDAWLAVPANVERLQVGDNFYIRAVDVPDFWWDGTKKLALEGEKVDLTNLLTIEDAALIYAKQTIFRSTMLIAGDWVAAEDRFKITISDAAIVDGTKVIITPASQADLDKMTDAGFSPLPETTVGSVTVFAKKQPTENININYSISF